jgi:dTDP-4-amino-4,6-dideoxygalactose transaminase
MNDKPAILGGQPVFAAKIPIVRPLLPDFDDAFAEGVHGLLGSGMLTTGQHLRQLEKVAAEHLGVRHALAVSSCTTGLMLTYRGLGLTGDVVVPSFTFMATVSAMIWAGLRPVFADVDVDTLTLDPAAAEAAITPNTSAIVAVHNFGNPAEIEALQAIARRHHLKLVFDAAHGFGTLYHGVPVGPQGDAQVYSLSPTKLLIAGEGGIVATNDDDLAEQIRIGREYGNSGNYDSAFAGFNARMPEFNAMLCLRSLAMLEQAARRRNHVASRYHERLSALPGLGFQQIQSGNRSSYKDFSLTIDPDAFGLSRDQLAGALAAENIDTRKYYDPPVHLQTAYRQFAPPAARLPRTNLLAARSLSLPIWSHMEDAVALGICRAIQRIHTFAGHV